MHGYRGALRPLVSAIILGACLLGTVASAAPPGLGAGTASLDSLDRPGTITLTDPIFHLQGLDLDDSAIYLTSVDKASHRGYLQKFSLNGTLLATVDLSDGPRYHVGGISLDGESIWVPVAEYRRGSTTRVVEVDKATLTPRVSFLVGDHIGAVAAGPDGIVGANWDAARVYRWDRAGHELSQQASPTRVSYQDLKFVDGALVASGTTLDRHSGMVDWLDPNTLMPRYRLAVGKTADGIVWTREGMAMKDGTLYLLPRDGAGGTAQIYLFDLAGTVGDNTAPCDDFVPETCALTSRDALPR